jgi:SpoVK/Ycf46/Vps4 family AAA+-type ATPase
MQPCIVFFDEVDAVAGRRQEGGESGVYERVLTQLLTELDGVAVRGRVFTLACTSRPWLLDPAFLRPGRVDSLLYVPPPALTDRLEILQQRCAGGVLHEEVSLQWLADATAGMSGAEMVALLREAALDAERGGQRQLLLEDLERQLRMERERPALQPYLDFLAGRTG